MRNLIVFVECDPSHQIFKGFRASKDFFTDFSGNLLGGLIERLPSLEHVTFDRYPAVWKDGELMTRLRNVVEEKRKRIVWVPGKWDDPVSLQGRVNKTLRSDLLCAIEAIMGHEQA